MHTWTIKFASSRQTTLSLIPISVSTLLCATFSLHFGICTNLTGVPSSNLVSSHQKTPLYKAAGGGHADTVEYLIQAGADINIKNEDGVSE